MPPSLKPSSGMPDQEAAPARQIAGLAAYAQQRKQNSRERLLAAAVAKFSDEHYAAVSVEDIAAAAGVNRVTFYRHFSSKADLLVHLYENLAATGRPKFLSIAEQDYRNPDVVRAWLNDVFARQRGNVRFQTLFTHAAAIEPAFTARAHDMIGDLISQLGAVIPAFAADRHRTQDEKRWLEAWLLLYEIFDQSSHAAMNSGVAAHPVLIDVLIERFLRFVGSLDKPA